MLVFSCLYKKFERTYILCNFLFTIGGRAKITFSQLVHILHSVFHRKMCQEGYKINSFLISFRFIHKVIHVLWKTFPKFVNLIFQSYIFHIGLFFPCFKVFTSVHEHIFYANSRISKVDSTSGQSSFSR